jgi:uncharacterized membrane protein YbhN (UPF0104 family)
MLVGICVAFVFLFIAVFIYGFAEEVGAEVLCGDYSPLIYTLYSFNFSEEPVLAGARLGLTSLRQ